MSGSGDLNVALTLKAQTEGKEQVDALGASLNKLGDGAPQQLNEVGQQLGNVGIKASAASEAIRNAFCVVGVRSAKEIQTDIHEVDVALMRLSIDTQVSGEEFDRAFAAGRAKLAALRLELLGTSAAARG